jgi:hypothetical protein
VLPASVLELGQDLGLPGAQILEEAAARISRRVRGARQGVVQLARPAVQFRGLRDQRPAVEGLGGLGGRGEAVAVTRGGS